MQVQRLTWYSLPLAKVPSVIKVFFCVDVLLCLLYLADNLLGNPNHALTVLLDLDGEHSLGTWYSSMQLFCIALSSFVFCYSKFNKDKASLPLLLLPALFVLMSLDEAIQIHEWLGHQTDGLFMGQSRYSTSFSSTGIWMFVIGIPFIVLFKLYASSIKHYFQENQYAFKKLILGMTIMLAGALGIEILTNFISKADLFLVVVLEEGMEMIGVTIMLWATYDLAIQAIANNPSLLTRQS